ncbi:Fatty acid hydroxylase superfamily [Seminavis robusta]|uniref:Fatty acid hydroxylase superfamily n=1 Tax=Seminavis robusta TaxID=568900 RepID=A0A9N8DJ33_9STRA|nr:Fatty acid hydroxylase superfamily [Seminavis robusta]|eukprot:Sro112_g055670.1 Fatty acid hydroxylase superfamily (280) ;mRNA; r:57168-58007
MTVASISPKTFALYMLNNGFLSGIAYLALLLGNQYGYMGILIGWTFRSLFLCWWLTHGAPALGIVRRIYPVSSSDEEPLLPQILIMIKGGALESLLIYLVCYWEGIRAGAQDEAASFLLQFATFIPKSFIWELIFDFGHYWTHRACHANMTVYKYVHWDHHEHEKPGALSSFRMSIPEILFSNVLPAVAAFGLCYQRFTLFQLHLIFTFKTAVEIGGHSAIEGDDLFSFPQAGPLLKEICLGPGDHDLHHRQRQFNFSKRFRLWDMIFGTFKEPKSKAV